EFRTAIDAQATLLFAPTEISAGNLEAEDVAGSIFVTGNTGIDALLTVAPKQAAGVRESGKLRLLVTCHRRESWGAGLCSIAGALIELAASHALEINFVLHPNPAVGGTMRELLAGRAGIRLLEPLGHARMIAEMAA